MAIYRDETCIFLSNHLTIRIHAKSAHPVIKGLWIEDKFGFVNNISNFFEHSGRQFHTDTNIDRAGPGSKTKQLRLLFHPASTCPTRGNDHKLAGQDLAIGQFHATDLAIFSQKVLNPAACADLFYFLVQGLAHACQNSPAIFSTHMAYAGRYKR